MIRLLILGCSAAKRHDAGLMPAVERYDGPAFRVLRKARREGVIDEDTRVRILSAKYGLISELEEIEDYDQVMTPARAAELVGPVSAHLRWWLRQHPECKDVFVNVGSAYRSVLVAVLVDLTEHCRKNGIHVTMASGGIGMRCAEMKAWLGDGHGRARTDTDVRNGEQP